MRRTLELAIGLLAIGVFSGGLGAKCRGRFYEMRGGDGFVAQRGCRGLDTQISEDYWTTIGYDGLLRDGRTTDDFLVFPDSPRNSFVGYWITRSKYGDNRHYEAFGHVFIKPDGRVCGWFVGMEQEVVEVCGGFRVLSRSRRAPHEAVPFEWVQGQQYRNRDTLGFHHHKIAKYEVNADETFFGDADINGRKFQGVSPISETFVQVDSPDTYFRKVWLLKKKSVAPIHDTRPANIIAEPPRRNNQLVNYYSDPHHEARISAEDARRLNSNNIPNQFNYPYRVDVPEQPYQIQNPSANQNQPAPPPPSRRDPGYKEWLLNQYRLRGIDPYRAAYEQRSNGGSGQQSARVAYEVQPQGVIGSVNPYQGDNQLGGGQRVEPSIVEDSGAQGGAERDDRESVTEYGSNPSEVDIGADSIQTGGFDNQQQTSETGSLSPEPQHVRLVRYRPRTVIRDKKGNMYEQHIENGKIFFYTVPKGDDEQPRRIEIADIDPKIEAILEKRRRQEERYVF